jgi:hypothetical protein
VTRTAAAVVVFVAFVFGGGRAMAHPAGFTSVNRYVGVRCDARGVLHIAYLLDFAELPSYSEFDQLDADHDGTVTPGEQRAYLDRRVPPLLATWAVTVNGQRAAVRMTGASLEVRDGERGMSTLRIAADVVAETPEPVSPTGELRVTVRDPAFADRSGWREMAGDDSSDTVLAGGARERSADALAYESSPVTTPPRVDEAAFVFRRAKAEAEAAPAPAASAPVARPSVWARVPSAMRRASGLALLALAFAVGLAVVLGSGLHRRWRSPRASPRR